MKTTKLFLAALLLGLVDDCLAVHGKKKNSSSKKNPDGSTTRYAYPANYDYLHLTSSPSQSIGEGSSGYSRDEADRLRVQVEKARDERAPEEESAIALESKLATNEAKDHRSPGTPSDGKQDSYRYRLALLDLF